MPRLADVLFVHLPVLTECNNRVSALADWAVARLGRGSRQRPIAEQLVLARTRMVGS